MISKSSSTLLRLVLTKGVKRQYNIKSLCVLPARAFSTQAKEEVKPEIISLETAMINAHSSTMLSSVVTFSGGLLAKLIFQQFAVQAVIPLTPFILGTILFNSQLDSKFLTNFFGKREISKHQIRMPLFINQSIYNALIFSILVPFDLSGALFLSATTLSSILIGEALFWAAWKHYPQINKIKGSGILLAAAGGLLASLTALDPALILPRAMAFSAFFFWNEKTLHRNLTRKNGKDPLYLVTRNILLFIIASLFVKAAEEAQRKSEQGQLNAVAVENSNKTQPNSTILNEKSK